MTLILGQFRVSNENFGQTMSSFITIQEKPKKLGDKVWIGKRFTEKVESFNNYEQSKTKFAKLHQKKKTMQEQMEIERMKNKHAQVKMLR